MSRVCSAGNRTEIMQNTRNLWVAVVGEPRRKDRFFVVVAPDGRAAKNIALEHMDSDSDCVSIRVVPLHLDFDGDCTELGQ